MTDEQMDARLRAAGDAWRTANDRPAAIPTAIPTAIPPAIPTVEPSAPAPARRLRRHGTALLASAAVVATALVAGGAILLGHTSDDKNRVTNTDEAATLRGTTWRLLGYDGDPRRVNSTATLSIDGDGKLVADDSCNLITGKVNSARGRLAVTDLDRRFYNCTDSAGEVSFDRGIKTLGAHPTWSASHGTLTISGAGPTMHFAAADELIPPTADRPTLTGATWQLTTVTDAHGTALPVYGAATFKIEKGRLEASDTCNTMFGSVRVEGSTITSPGGLNITAMACTEGMDTATVVDAVFDAKVTATVAGATLTIARAGAGTLTYRWVPADERATDPHRLTSTGWHLASLAGVRSGANVTLRLSPDGTLVLDGCAKLTGRAQIGAGTLTTSGLPADAPKGCADDVTTLLSFLAAHPALWSIQRDHLLIYGGGAQAFSLVFDPTDAASAHSEPLAGPSWKLTGISVEAGNAASGSGSSDSGIALTLTDKTYSLHTDCGTWRGPVHTNAGTIEFGAATATPGGHCAVGQLTDVLNVVDGTATWSLHENQLELKKGNVTLTFEP